MHPGSRSDAARARGTTLARLFRVPTPPDPSNSFFVDFSHRIRRIQAEMARRGIDAYVGSRSRTLSWTLDAFCPWRSFVVIPLEGPPTAITFAIDVARLADESWLDTEHVLGYAPRGGKDPISVLSDVVRRCLLEGRGTVGLEIGMSRDLTEGHLTWYEYEQLTVTLPGVHLVNAHDIVDALSLIEDMRWCQASRFGWACKRCMGWGRGPTRTIT